MLSPGVGGKPTKAMPQRESPPKLAPLDGNEASDGMPDLGARLAATHAQGTKKPMATPAAPSAPVLGVDKAMETASDARDDSVPPSTIVRVASTSSFASVNLE